MSDPDQGLGHTVDADEATMAEMRRYAEAARKSAADVTLPVPDEIAASRPTDAPTGVPDVAGGRRRGGDHRRAEHDRTGFGAGRRPGASGPAG